MDASSEAEFQGRGERRGAMKFRLDNQVYFFPVLRVRLVLAEAGVFVGTFFVFHALQDASLIACFPRRSTARDTFATSVPAHVSAACAIMLLLRCVYFPLSSSLYASVVWPQSIA